MPVYQSVKERLNASAQKSAVLFVTVAPGLALAEDTGQIESAISSLQATILEYIGLGIGACVAILLVSLAGDIGISVAKKWLRKGAS